MDKKLKLLIINSTLRYGGSDLVAIRLQQALDKDKFDFTYCVNSDDCPLEEYVTSLGARVIHQSSESFNYYNSYKFFLDLFEKEHFDIVHSHSMFFSAIAFLAAYKRGVKVRISHSHFSKPVDNDSSSLKKLIGRIYRLFMRKAVTKYSTDIIGCSLESGQYLAGKKGFSKKGIILNNGIDTNKYLPDNDIRNKIRKEFKLDGKTVIGHIGAIYYLKNQNFIIDIFKEYQKKHSESVLMLVGDGEDKNKLEQKCCDLGISDKVIFTGVRNDVNELLMAMDCMVFPSLHEGFPLTLIEAQASKLPCIVSDTVSDTVKLNDNLCFKSLDDSIEAWCNAIDKVIAADRNSIDNSRLVNEFDLSNVAKKLEAIYFSRL